MASVLYDHVRDGGRSPILIRGGKIFPTDRQEKDWLLCKPCEDIMSAGGEAWMCPRLAWTGGRFDFYHLLKAPTRCPTNDGALHLAANNPEILVDKVAHFVMGVFWKAAVHPWTPGGAAALITIEEHDDIRKWLRGEGAFPRLMALAITIARPQHAQITFNPPEEVREGHKRSTTSMPSA